MRNIYLLMLLALVSFSFTSCDKDEIIKPEQEMELLSSKANKDKLTGVDEWGFNFQAHHFDNYLINAILGDPAFANFPHYKQTIYNGEGISFWNDLISDYDYIPYMMPVDLLDCKLIMHWNEGLLSKDGIYPDTWIDSNGWITFHFKMNKDGEKWSYFRKLVSSRSTDYMADGIWYDQYGNEIGVQSYDWPTLIITQIVNTGDVPFFFDQTYTSPYGPGFGKYKLKSQHEAKNVEQGWFSGSYWSPIFCNGDMVDFLEGGTLRIHYVMRYEPNVIYKEIDQIKGEVTSSLTGETFKIREIDRYLGTPDSFIGTWHYNLIGDMGTHYIGTLTMDMNTGAITIEQTVCN
ncbi:hypothetical protein RXV94_05520 [Yeosuana sp. MJ-SS3]|uniref:Uncharacterized protein n=1 Tax=Gilvirhabdus luticola TaxID=3079858 RepID=A0ABU3U5C2_9FLAO|nr:hypothetical protein [Yeosuana sp. MJ-SS3]MDU8885609.1 hypothetical protein [Yeosuana sp. MJ-SS3]